jgi:putative hydroxymethylpyrimidine transport system substrate-binding protein
VRTKNVGFDLSPALAAGKVDAVIGAYWNIELVELERRGIDARAFRLEENGVPDYDELVVVTSDDVARGQPELVRSFLRGLRRGQDWAATDQAGAVEALVDANRDLDPDVVKEQLDLTADLLSPPDEPTLTVDPAEWAAFATWMRDAGLVTRPLDAAAAVTDRFVPEEPS